MNAIAKKIIFYVSLIIIWQVVADANIWEDSVFPSPYEVAEDLAYGAADGSLFYGIGTTLWRLLTGLAIAIAGGLVLGIFMAVVAQLKSLVEFLQAVHPRQLVVVDNQLSSRV